MSPVFTYEVVVVVATCTVFLNTLYPTTPTLSVLGDHVRLIEDEVILDEVSPVGIDGATTSEVVVHTVPFQVVPEVQDAVAFLVSRVREPSRRVKVLDP